MIAVTGMHRSGTSCFAGLLARCGFSLGKTYPLLNESRPDNEKGHFENLGAVAINETLLRCAGGSWSSPPSADRIAITGKRFDEHMKQFSMTFDGDLFKDPRTCLTIASWEKNCSDDLEYVVLCLRHPASVALSLQKRDNMEIEAGLALWLRYNQSLLDGICETPLIVADYDQLKFGFVLEVARLTKALGVRISKRQISRQTGNFYSESLNHACAEDIEAIKLPGEIASLYRTLRSFAHESKRKREVKSTETVIKAKFFCGGV